MREWSGRSWGSDNGNFSINLFKIFTLFFFFFETETEIINSLFFVVFFFLLGIPLSHLVSVYVDVLFLFFFFSCLVKFLDKKLLLYISIYFERDNILLQLLILALFQYVLSFFENPPVTCHSGASGCVCLSN